MAASVYSTSHHSCIHINAALRSSLPGMKSGGLRLPKFIHLIQNMSAILFLDRMGSRFSWKISWFCFEQKCVSLQINSSLSRSFPSPPVMMTDGGGVRPSATHISAHLTTQRRRQPLWPSSIYCKQASKSNRLTSYLPLNKHEWIVLHSNQRGRGI